MESSRDGTDLLQGNTAVVCQQQRQRIFGAALGVDIRFEWVRSHDGRPLNAIRAMSAGGNPATCIALTDSSVL